MTNGREDKQTHLAGACVIVQKVLLCFVRWKKCPSKKVSLRGLKDNVVNWRRHFETAAVRKKRVKLFNEEVLKKNE